MAKQSDSFLGGFSGRLGPAVGYRWRGRWCLRSLPTAVHNPRSEAQQRHRSLFAQQVRLAARFLQVLRQTLDAPSLALHMTPCNLFVSLNRHAFGDDGGALAVDWAALRLSTGPVAPVAFTACSLSADGTLEAAFLRNPLHLRADSHDLVRIFAFCPAADEGFLTMPVYRRDAHLAAVLPDAMAGLPLQLWAVVRDEKGRWSETVYVGEARPGESHTAEAETGDATAGTAQGADAAARSAAAYTPSHTTTNTAVPAATTNHRPPD